GRRPAADFADRRARRRAGLALHRLLRGDRPARAQPAARRARPARDVAACDRIDDRLIDVIKARLPDPLPEGVRGIGADEPGGAWLSTLGHVLGEGAERWQLEVGEPFAGASASLTLRAIRAGEPVVLKLQFPDREADHEAAALAEWDGN